MGKGCEAMTKQIEAIYEQCVFRPLEPVELPESAARHRANHAGEAEKRRGRKNSPSLRRVGQRLGAFRRQ